MSLLTTGPGVPPPRTGGGDLPSSPSVPGPGIYFLFTVFGSVGSPFLHREASRSYEHDEHDKLAKHANTWENASRGKAIRTILSDEVEKPPAGAPQEVEKDEQRPTVRSRGGVAAALLEHAVGLAT